MYIYQVIIKKQNLKQGTDRISSKMAGNKRIFELWEKLEKTIFYYFKL